jgi:hypothetical protein
VNIPPLSNLKGHVTMVVCAACGKEKPRSEYAGAQLKKKEGQRCRACAAGVPTPARPGAEVSEVAAAKPTDVRAFLAEVEKQMSSRSAAEFGLEEGLLAKVLPCLAPTASVEVSAFATRVLTAISMHDGLTERLLAGDCLPPLLQRLATSPDSLAILITTLLHNLADTPATRQKLAESAALFTLTRTILDPASSDELKEHCLTAVASMAGLAAEAVSFPQTIGTLCAADQPQEALRAMQLMVDRPELRQGLARVKEVHSGLRAASSSPDGQVAAQALEMLKLLG